MGIFDELSVTSKIESLEEQPKSGLDENLITVEAEGEAKLALIEQLHDLNDMLACIADCNDS